jgi:hypothetical protein
MLKSRVEISLVLIREEGGRQVLPKKAARMTVPRRKRRLILLLRMK